MTTSADALGSLEPRTLHAIFDGVADGIVVADADGRISYLNGTARRLHGVDELGVPLAEWSRCFNLRTLEGDEFPPERLPLARALLDGEATEHACWRIRRRDGAELLVEGTAAPIRDLTGTSRGALLVFRDVTNRERLQEAVRANEERFRGLSASSPVGIFHADLGGNVTWVNMRLLTLWEMDVDEALGRGWTTRVHPDDVAPLLSGWSTASADGREYEHEFRLLFEDGRTRTVHGRSAIIRDAQGNAVGTVGTVEDITERVRIEQAIAEAEERLRLALAAGSVGIWDYDPRADIGRWDARAKRALGLPLDQDVTWDSFADAVHPEDRERVMSTVERALDPREGGEYDEEFRARPVDGATRWVHARGRAFFAGRGEHRVAVRFLGTLVDVTERHEADAERERLLDAARRAARRTELLQSLTAAFGATLTEREVVRVVLEHGVPSLGAGTGLVLFMTPDRRAMTTAGGHGYAPGLLESLRLVPLDGPFATAAAVRRRETVLVRSPDEAMRDFPGLRPLYERGDVQSSVALPLIGGDGAVLGALAFNFGEPQRFDPEERALLEAIARQCAQAIERSRLYEAERRSREEAQHRRSEAEDANAAKSRFLATTSHEIRTPINAILGYTELLELGLPGPLTQQQRAYLERVRVSGRNLLAIVNQVLDLSKIEADKLEVNIEVARADAVAERAATQVEPQAVARGLSLSNACARGAEVGLLGDPQRVEQVLVNLLTNAVKFTEPGGRITLSCGHVDAPPEDARVSHAAPHGWAYFRVEDTGVGIPAERLEAVWDPFEQADASHTRTYGGTGLGLTISRRLARLMGGDITLRTREGEGSTFLVWIPASDRVPPGRGAERRTAVRLAHGLTRAADATLAQIERILVRYAHRLRTDPAIPHARALDDTVLEDHVATFLADVAQSLTVIEEARGTPSELLRDGSAIQRVIAERHGAQRARLGWTEAELRREFAILREEVAAAVRERIAADPDTRGDDALVLLARLVERAEGEALRTLAAPPAPER